MKYRKKPIVIEAVQWDGKNHHAVENNWDNDPRDSSKHSIHTISGWANIAVGDYIITEQDGVNYYPCKKDIFEASYEAVTE